MQMCSTVSFKSTLLRDLITENLLLAGGNLALPVSAVLLLQLEFCWWMVVWGFVSGGIVFYNVDLLKEKKTLF